MPPRTRLSAPKSIPTESRDAVSDDAERDERVSDDDIDSDDDEVVLVQPERALRSKYARILRTLFQDLVTQVDRSALPYFRTQIADTTTALHDFVTWLFEIHRDDGFIEDDNADCDCDDDEDDEEAVEDMTETDEEEQSFSKVYSDEEEEELSES